VHAGLAAEILGRRRRRTVRDVCPTPALPRATRAHGERSSPLAGATRAHGKGGDTLCGVTRWGVDRSVGGRL